MDSAGLRQRRDDEDGKRTRAPSRKKPGEKGDPIPKFTIDLTLPPERRYDHVAPYFQEHLANSNLTGLFADLVSALVGPLSSPVTSLARLLLRRVHDREETAELKGICSATGVPMHILVAFNVLLDLLLGCTSGGVRVLGDADKTRMVHFRTLDWGMDELRHLIVELDFIRGANTPVVATAVTYFGYVGVLTGARRGLTMSLNFRPHHCRETWRHRAAFRWHQALVVLGFRPSISSALRRILLLDKKEQALTEQDVVSILSTLSHGQSTAAYLILCTPQRVYVVENDHGSAQVRDSDTFLTAYNHDFADEDNPAHLAKAANEMLDGDAVGMAELVAYSLDRKARLDDLFGKRRRHDGLGRDVVTMEDVILFMRDKEICNEETHYAVVMDPESGGVIWRRKYAAPGGF